MNEDLILRDYQNKAIQDLREGIRAGHKRQILCAPTGSGKTEIAIAVIQEALAKRSETAFITDRLSILYQTEARFDRHGIPFGVLQAGHYRFRPWEMLQLCSTQTLARRGISTNFKLIIVDECHASYASTNKFLLSHPDVVALGLSASPFTPALSDVYSNVVNCTTTNALIEQGWLAPLKVFAARAVDMRGAALKFDGEWLDDEIEKRALVIIGDVVDEWTSKTLEHFGGPVKTILFSATVAHGEALCEKFQSLGHNFQQISYKDGNDEKRRSLIEEFRKPDSEIEGLVSVEALSKGFDVVDIRCVISAKPYRKSLSGHIQQLGRGMRPFPGKDYCLVLDHAGNFLRFYDDTMTFFEKGLSGLGKNHLDSTPRKDPGEKEKRQIVCGNCHYVMSASMTHCPCCGWERPRRGPPEHVAGEMVEIGMKSKADKKQEWMQDKEAVWRQIVGYALQVKSDRDRAEKFALAQYRNIYKEWPYRAMRNVEPMEPSLVVANKIRSMLIAYAHRRKA